MKIDLLNKENNPFWTDWHWQQRNSLKSPEDILKFFPNFPEEELDKIKEYSENFRFKLTPYSLDLFEKDELGNPVKEDPLVRQFFPKLNKNQRVDEYHEQNSNWELKEDFKEPIIQHKYPEKAVIRLTNVCLGYCNFCFEVKRTIDKKKTLPTSNSANWKSAMSYLKGKKEIKEIVISGGEPLVVDNETLDKRIQDIREIDHIKGIRIHTRALTFNPYRFDKELIDIIKKYQVTELGIHITHPKEITPEFKEALNRFDEQNYGSVLKMAQIPLLKEINDSRPVLKELFETLYFDCKVKPYYILHAMPSTLNSDHFRTSVKKGIELLSPLKRQISNVAMPEYIIVHKRGKHSVPLQEDLKYSKKPGNHPEIHFVNWEGKQSVYLDGID